MLYLAHNRSGLVGSQIEDGSPGEGVLKRGIATFRTHSENESALQTNLGLRHDVVERTVEAGPSRSAGVPNSGGDAGARPDDDKRLDGDNPFGDTLFTDRNWRIVDGLKKVAADLGETPARVALAWVAGRLGVASTLMGVSRADQVTDNVGALGLTLPSEAKAALDSASGEGGKFLYGLFHPAARNQMVFGGADVIAQPSETGA